MMDSFQRLVSNSICAATDRLKQVVLNLLSNAIKFTPGFTAGGNIGEVEVRCEMVASETEMQDVVMISVRDTGIGIPESAQSKLFDRFIQVGTDKY
jgi:signal transduction histidine kinase